MGLFDLLSADGAVDFFLVCFTFLQDGIETLRTTTVLHRTDNHWKVHVIVKSAKANRTVKINSLTN